MFAGLISTQALFPYALEKWFGLNGNYFLLFGGVILIITLLQNPEGVAGRVLQDAPTRSAGRPARRRRAPPCAAHACGGRGRRDGGGPPVLAAEGVSVDFGGVHALRDVSFEVGEGELVGLIGPNGAGKTTFVDAVTGFVRCSGRVLLDGRDLGGAAGARARAARARAHLAERRAVRRPARRGEPRRRPGALRRPGRIAFRTRTDQRAIDETLALFDLGWAAKASPADLSQGHRKLVGVARALAARPRLLMLDEPAAGLDTRESEALGAHLRAIADGGQSTLLIDHDMGLVLSICDRVVVLEFGEVIADGRARDGAHATRA